MLLLLQLHKWRPEVHQVLHTVFTDQSLELKSVHVWFHTYSDAMKCYSNSENILGSEKGENNTEVWRNYMGLKCLLLNIVPQQ